LFQKLTERSTFTPVVPHRLLRSDASDQDEQTTNHPFFYNIILKDGDGSVVTTASLKLHKVPLELGSIIEHLCLI